ncbi:MAG: hypothetical protein WCX70_02880 [Candidatus Paceibacterota bacterium]|jgi:hypothetical protein
MDQSTQKKISSFTTTLQKIDNFSDEFLLEIKKIVDDHKVNGGHLEYVYVQHFQKEIVGLSNLFQYLLKDDKNQKYTFFAVRGSFEVLLYLEYVLRLKDEDDNKILELFSKDMAQSASALNDAIPTDKDHLMNKTIGKIAIVNKILETDFNLEKIKSNTRPFPDIRSLCNKSSLKIKDSAGSDMYHLYSMYSESNHLRLGSQHAITEDISILTLFAIEYFLEIYIKFYQLLLDTNIYSDEYRNKLNEIKTSIGLN